MHYSAVGLSQDLTVTHIFIHCHHAIGRMVSDRISFRCRMRERNQPRTDVLTYQVVEIVGNLSFYFNSSGHEKELAENKLPSGRKRTHDQHDSESSTSSNDCKGTLSISKLYNGNGTSSPATSAQIEQQILFKGFVQIIPSSPMAELSLIDANLDEYVSRLSLDGTLLFADHR